MFTQNILVSHGTDFESYNIYFQDKNATCLGKDFKYLGAEGRGSTLKGMGYARGRLSRNNASTWKETGKCGHDFV